MKADADAKGVGHLDAELANPSIEASHGFGRLVWPRNSTLS
jgi:hypothetical protein